MVFHHDDKIEQFNEVVFILFFHVRCCTISLFSVAQMIRCPDTTCSLALYRCVGAHKLNDTYYEIWKSGWATNFICVITNLPIFLACELSPSIFVETFFLVACIEKPRITYSVSFIRVFRILLSFVRTLYKICGKIK